MYKAPPLQFAHEIQLLNRLKDEPDAAVCHALSKGDYSYMLTIDLVEFKRRVLIISSQRYWWAEPQSFLHYHVQVLQVLSGFIWRYILQKDHCQYHYSKHFTCTSFSL